MKNNLVNSNIEYDIISSILNITDIKEVVDLFTDTDKTLFGDFSASNIFEILRQQIRADNLPDISITAHKLKAEGAFETELEARTFIRSIKDRNKKIKDYSEHLKILKDLKQRRHLLSQAEKLKKDVLDTESDINNALSEHRNNLTIFETKDFIISSGNIEQKRKEGIEERKNTGKGFFTGFENIDEFLTVGFVPGISIIAARPAMGKSALKTNYQRYLGKKGAGVVSFCLEQDFQIEMDRTTALASGENIKDIIQVWNWKDDHLFEENLKIAREMDKSWNIHYIDKRTMHTSEAIDIMHMLNTYYNIDVVFIDLFDRFLDVNILQNKHDVVAQKLTELSEWARILNLHLCLIVQINRKGIEGKNKCPTMADLKSSGAYEEQAYMIQLLHWEGAYDDTLYNKPYEVHIAKQKQGPPGIAYFDFDKERMTFTENYSII